MSHFKPVRRSSPPAVNFLLYEKQKSWIMGAIPPPQEGRIAIVMDAGCGMRWTRERRETNALHADGQAVWSWRPDAGVKFPEGRSGGDGGYQARHPGEITEQPLKPSRRECRLIRLNLW